MARELMKDQMFSELLVSAGYEVDFAIGTTYSLNFDAMLSVPISMGMLGELDDSTLNNPYYLLESIRRSSDKFAIFCNKGGIAVPANVKTVYSLLEKSIFEVSNKKDKLANFHPKIWIIKEHSIDDENQRQIKLIVLSRNLTFDTSLDIAASLTAPLYRKHISKEIMRKHQPLKDMVEWLAEYAIGDKKRQIKSLAEDIDCLGEFQIDEPFYDYEFFPFKYGELLNPIDLEKAMTGRRMITVSPFIDMPTLKRINEKSKSYSDGASILITRDDYVNEEVFDFFDREQDAIYVVNESMLDNEVATIYLHAKCYYVSDPRDDSKSNYLYLGSANATNTAFTRNTEFLLRLQFKPYQKNLWETVLAQFVNDDDGRFVPVLQRPTTKESERVQYTELDKLLIEVTRCLFESEAKENSDGSFSLYVSCNKLPKGCKVYVAPMQLGSDSLKEIDNPVVFERICPEHLSELYIIKVEKLNEVRDSVIKIRTTGIPDNRDILIVQSLVNTKEKFIDYVTMMLSDNPAELVFENERDKNMKGSSSQTVKQPALYERLLRVAYEDPKQLKYIDTFVKEMKKDVVGESFEKMYSKFMSIFKKLERL